MKMQQINGILKQIMIISTNQMQGGYNMYQYTSGLNTG